MFSTIIHFITLYPTIPLTVVSVLLLIYTVYLHHKISKFTRGESGVSLEQVIRTCIQGVEDIKEKNELISKHALELHNRVSHSLRNAHMMRYKAFESNGSSQSFSVALVNELGNGVILTSLHSRDRISTFAKPIEKYSCIYDLTEEEQSVLEESKKAHKA
jgi:hypothetical protein